MFVGVVLVVIDRKDGVLMGYVALFVCVWLCRLPQSPSHSMCSPFIFPPRTAALLYLSICLSSHLYFPPTMGRGVS